MLPRLRELASGPTSPLECVELMAHKMSPIGSREGKSMSLQGAGRALTGVRWGGHAKLGKPPLLAQTLARNPKYHSTSILEPT